jgi:hypothetical protein
VLAQGFGQLALEARSYLKHGNEAGDGKTGTDLLR